MHPAMAVWIWSMTMSRVWRATLMGEEYRPEIGEQPRSVERCNPAPMLVPANPYLHSDIDQHPLPDILLDRLADLYWTERDAELAI
jgi:hypothetical protein